MRTVPVMAEIVTELGLQDAIRKAGYASADNFEAFYDDLSSSGKNRDLLQMVERRVHEYFATLQLPPTVTVYDYLVLTLREKDVIATFNWDPFLIQAFRRNRDIAILPRILFLHGNTAVGMCVSCRVKGYLDDSCPHCGKPLAPTRLLYPVKDKNYVDDPFIVNEWEELNGALQQANHVTFFGYSSPTTDAAARELMLGSWNSNPGNIFAGVEIIDVKPRGELKKLWQPFMANRKLAGYYKSIHNTQIFRHPRRSCEAWIMAVMQGSPWHNNAIPKFSTLPELHVWMRELLEEEETGSFKGRV